MLGLLTGEVVKAYLRYDRGIEYEFFPDARQLREPFPEKGGSQDPDGPIGAIVYDLDQTLIDSGIRDLRYEENMAHAVMPYKVYEGVRELTSLPIPDCPSEQSVEMADGQVAFSFRSGRQY